MVTKSGSTGEKYYILPVCKVTCLNLCYFLRYPLRRRSLLLGHSVKSRIPLRNFLIFGSFCFLSVYVLKFEIKIMKKYDIKKIDFMVQNRRLRNTNSPITRLKWPPTSAFTAVSTIQESVLRT